VKITATQAARTASPAHGLNCACWLVFSNDLEAPRLDGIQRAMASRCQVDGKEVQQDREDEQQPGQRRMAAGVLRRSAPRATPSKPHSVR